MFNIHLLCTKKSSIWTRTEVTFCPQGYYNDSYYQDPNSGVAEAEEPGQSAMFDDEGVRRQTRVFCVTLKIHVAFESLMRTSFLHVSS